MTDPWFVSIEEEKMRRSLCAFVISVFVCGIFVYPPFVLAGPTDQVRPTLDRILEVLSDTSLKGDSHKTERRAKIMSIIKTRFDFQEMSRRVLGKTTWQEISNNDRDHYTSLMTELLENVYIGKLESYSGQQIDYTGEKIKKNKALVSTTIENNGEKIPLHYILLNSKSSWMVYDINIDGVSLIKNYRQQFKSVLKRDKFPGLVKELEKMNKELAGETKK